MLPLCRQHWHCNNMLQGNAEDAIARLEPQLFHLTGQGVHPLHHRCMDIYTCLAAAWRNMAVTATDEQDGQHAAACYAKAAVNALLLSCAFQRVLEAGGLLLRDVSVPVYSLSSQVHTQYQLPGVCIRIASFDGNTGADCSMLCLV